MPRIDSSSIDRLLQRVVYLSWDPYHKPSRPSKQDSRINLPLGIPILRCTIQAQFLDMSIAKLMKNNKSTISMVISICRQSTSFGHEVTCLFPLTTIRCSRSFCIYEWNVLHIAVMRAHCIFILEVYQEHSNASIWRYCAASEAVACRYTITHVNNLLQWPFFALRGRLILQKLWRCVAHTSITYQQTISRGKWRRHPLNVNRVLDQKGCGATRGLRGKEAGETGRRALVSEWWRISLAWQS